VEEIQFASEQEAHGFRRLLTSEIEESRTLRQMYVVEMQENKDFREQQSLALLQSDLAGPEYHKRRR
jgi:hypothetical protein